MLDAAAVYENLQAVREKSPLVHNITNYVVMNTTANALLAAGASPVMAHAIGEMREMTGIASALVLNIGTLSDPWIASMKEAAVVARNRGIPVVIDPVGAGATALRTDTAKELIELAGSPVVRGNGSEIRSLIISSGETKGVDSTIGSDEAVEVASRYAAANARVVCVSGAVDYITDGTAVHEIRSGSPLMSRVTGTGCTSTALIGAFCAVNDDLVEATANAMAVMAVCGELAAADAAGPGSWQVNFLDRLHSLGLEELKVTLK